MPALRYDPAVSDSGVRLSDLLVSMSLATDLGFGQPTEHMLRSARIGMRLGERLGLDTGADGHALRRRPADLRRLPDLRQRGGQGLRGRHRLPGAGGRGRPGRVPRDGVHAAPSRFRQIGVQPRAARPRRSWPPAVARWSSRWPRTARRPARSPTVSDWARTSGRASSRPTRGGTGVASPTPCPAPDCPWRRGSRTSPRPARCSSAPPASTRRWTWSAPAAAPTSTPRSRGWPRPTRGRCSTASARTPSTRSSLPSRSSAPTSPTTSSMPRSRRSATSATCGAPFFAGHARGTADLVAAAAELLQMPPTEARLAYRAALVHDVGRFGVDASVWAKPGPLSASQRERMRLHVYYVERIFDRPAAAAPDRPAGRHPPRADGRLGLPPRRRRGDALRPGPGAGRRRRLPRDAAASPVSRGPHRGRRARATPGRRRAGTARRRVGRRRADRGRAPH